jgi:ribonuclease HII
MGMLNLERRLRREGYQVIVGIDEAGRGPLAGPVVASAVALKSFDFSCRIDDSKRLSAQQRQRAYPQIIEKSVFGIGRVDEALIDRHNILVATRMAMEMALNDLLQKSDPATRTSVYVLVDGNMALDVGLPCRAIVKGDAKSLSIAAASIVAKVTRDRIMEAYDELYPEYGFTKHKGYPTKVHRLALQEHGLCAIHRVSFCGV